MSIATYNSPDKTSYSTSFRSQQIRHAAMAVIEDFGLDPSRIRASELSADGYSKLVIGVDGKRVIENNGLVYTREAWPEGCWEKLVAILEGAAA